MGWTLVQALGLRAFQDFCCSNTELCCLSWTS